MKLVKILKLILNVFHYYYYYYYYYVHLYCATRTMCNVSVKLNRRRNEDQVPLVEGLSEVVSF